MMHRLSYRSKSGHNTQNLDFGFGDSCQVSVELTGALLGTPYDWLAMVRWVARQDRTPDITTQDSGHET